MKHILMISGSARSRSFNLQLAQKAAEFLGEGVQVSYLYYADLPYMNQDIEYPPPEQVVRVRNAVTAADGLWIMTPEYNGSYSGFLKNLLDWLSRPMIPRDPQKVTVLLNKKVTVSGAAGKSACGRALPKLQELLCSMRMDIMPGPVTGVTLDAEEYACDVLALSGEEEAALRTQAEAFLAFLEE